jgi:hypothetical protein
MVKEENAIELKDLVEIEPIEYTYATRGRYPRPARIIRYRDVNMDFLYTITDDIINRAIHHPKLKQKLEITRKGNYIFYEYANRPQIIIDLTAKKFYVTRKTLEQYKERVCQQQASIVMRFFLQANGLAFFRRLQVKWDTHVVGKTPEDRKITIRALRYLFNDPE